MRPSCPSCRAARRALSSSARTPSSTEYLARQLRDPYVRAREAAGLRSRAAFKLLELDARAALIVHGAAVVDRGAAPGGWSQVAADAVGGGAPLPPPPPPIDARGGGGGSGCGSAPGALGVPAAAAAGASVLAGGSPRRASFFSISAAEAAAAAGVGAARGARPAAATSEASSAAAPAAQPLRVPAPLVFAVDLSPMAPLAGVQVVRGDAFGAPVRAALRGLLAPHGARADVLLSDMAHAFTGSASTDAARQAALGWAALLLAADALRTGGALVIKVRYGDEYAPLRAAVARRFSAALEIKPPASRADSAEAFLVGKGLRAGVAFSPAERVTLAAFGLAPPP
jgi:23S rRNA U2552 (ribose-2'-O)-methylase RlmE/FtsJ